ncbi:phytoene desaturase family protein [Ilumatobacter nonamiensis]|uniref:phytoene desaturase family protein n=1 Tax=Ilumatobacter nonamiensis TaxID=467093 RepID=UPI00034660EF|nr:NAD(P)/FAD-dependent oxidoreductase [Ilumatobacter nonamiensis]
MANRSNNAPPTGPGGRVATVVGAGPNGLVAAITLAQAGWNVTVLEAASTPGGGMRSQELTLPDFVHDVCSAVHPLAVASPAFRELFADETAARRHGLAWLHPEVPLAHPLDGGGAALLHRSVETTAAGLGVDASAYQRLVQPFVDAGLDLTDGLLAPLNVPPAHPIHLARFGLHGVWSARGLARRRFDTDEAQALFAGLAAHSILSLRAPITAGYGLMLGTLAHSVGWPVAQGGSQRIADALVSVLESHGGRVECDHRVGSLRELPPSDVTLLDVTPRQLLNLAGDELPSRYRRSLERFRYGPGVFKLDWALDGPIPWTNPEIARAATVHLGGTLDEIVQAEDIVQQGRHAEQPFVLLAQQSVVDPDRAPAGSHTAWGYCHVPNGSAVDMTGRIEAQVERFAPGFRDRILARHSMNTAAMERHGENYVGGDINGGVADLRQYLIRPTLGLHPWTTPLDGVYLCSSSTPPGGGVHGMCGLHAANEVLRAHR